MNVIKNGLRKYTTQQKQDLIKFCNEIQLDHEKSIFMNDVKIVNNFLKSLNEIKTNEPFALKRAVDLLLLN